VINCTNDRPTLNFEQAGTSGKVTPLCSEMFDSNFGRDTEDCKLIRAFLQYFQSDA
jgi:hypothetical protein